MELRFNDHASFHRAALGMVGTSAILGFALQSTSMAPAIAGVAGMVVGATVAYRRVLWRSALGAAGLLAVVFLMAGPVAFIAAGLMTGLALSVGLRGTRALLTIALGALVTVTAIWAGARIEFAQETARWPLWATSSVASAAAGMVGLLALLPRHLALSSDPVATALRRLPTGLDAEVRALCARSVGIWTSTRARLAADDHGRELLRDGVLKTLEVAARSAGGDASPGAGDELTRRMAELDRRIEASTDAEVRAQYTAARAALDDQRRYRERIQQGRERLVARLHNHVAALEKFQLAALGVDAMRSQTSTATLVEQLEALSADVASSGEALAELELPAATIAPADAPADPSVAADATAPAVA
jgi:hypothetical protein